MDQTCEEREAHPTSSGAPARPAASDGGRGASSRPSVPNTEVSNWGSLLLAIPLAALLFLLFWISSESWVAQLFVKPGAGFWVPPVLLLFGTWASVILALKLRKLRRQRNVFVRDLLPFTLGETIDQDNLHSFRKNLESADHDQRTFLHHRVLRGLEHYHASRNRAEVAAVLAAQSEIDASGVHASFAMLRTIIWAIPILGFIGTVIGISSSVSQFSSDVEALKVAIDQITAGLAMAFDTTLIALVMSLLIMLPTSYLQKAEQHLLDQVDDYCNKDLLPRLASDSDKDAQLWGHTAGRELFEAAKQTPGRGPARTLEKRRLVTKLLGALRMEREVVR